MSWRTRAHGSRTFASCERSTRAERSSPAKNFSAERDASPTQPLRLSNPRSRCFAFSRMIRDSATPASRRSSAMRAPRASASTSVSGASSASSAWISRVARSTDARDCATRQRSAARRFSEKVPARSTRSVPLSIGKSRPITPARAPAADCPLAAMRSFPARDVPAEVLLLLAAMRMFPAREPSIEVVLLLAARRATPVRAPAATTAVAAAAVARVVGDNEPLTATAEAPLTSSSAAAKVARIAEVRRKLLRGCRRADEIASSAIAADRRRPAPLPASISAL